MEKSLFTPDYQTLLRHLREAREVSGLTQAQLGKRLGKRQSFVSKCERGEHRLDAIELRTFCGALGISIISFFQKLEPDLSAIEVKDDEMEITIPTE